MPSGRSSATIWVTGANGQLASEIRVLSESYPQYRFLFTSKEELPLENTSLVKDFFDKFSINFCINCAAYTAVDKAESEGERAFLINAKAAGALAEVCNLHQARLIHISTDYVYDDSLGYPLKEGSPTLPLSVYGRSKLEGEYLVLNRDPHAIIIRTSWLYSSFGNNFVKTMLRLFREKDEISVVNDQRGCPTYAGDLAYVIMQLTQQKEGNSFSGVLNYCNSGETTWYEFAKEIKAISNQDCKINPVPSSSYITAARRPQYSVLDTSRIQQLLHLPIPSWQESLKKCMAKLASV